MVKAGMKAPSGSQSVIGARQMLERLQTGCLLLCPAHLGLVREKKINKRIEVIAPSETKKEMRDYAEPSEHFLLSFSLRSISPRKSSHLG